jgi:hypothetical protein
MGQVLCAHVECVLRVSHPHDITIIFGPHVNDDDVIDFSLVTMLCVQTDATSGHDCA